MDHAEPLLALKDKEIRELKKLVASLQKQIFELNKRSRKQYETERDYLPYHEEERD